MAQSTTEQLAVVTGRSGIKLPDLNSEDWQARMWARTPLLFFHALWEANELDPSTEYEGGYQRGPRAYSHELVVPADADKPLTVIRGRFMPRDRQAIERDTDYNERRWAEYERPKTTTGTEVHEIAVPPIELGPMAVRWSVENVHTTGGYSNGWSNWDGPAFKRIDPETGEEQDYRRFNYFPEADSNMPMKDQQKAAAHAYSEALRTALKEIVEFLS